jgi:hypothetical protein
MAFRRRNPMHEFTLDQARRWDAWQRASALSAQRCDRMCRVCGMGMLAATLIAALITVWLQ